MLIPPHVYRMQLTYEYSFYNRRSSLFSRYDEGIRITGDQWFSVTPENIARVTALQIKRRFPHAEVVYDGFGGAGGNTIQLALLFDKVIYNELDEEICFDAHNNAEVYGVEDAIEFRNEDFFDPEHIRYLKQAQPDVVFLSPPWGGPQYLTKEKFDLYEPIQDGLEGMSIAKVVDFTVKNISPNICLFLPKTTNLEQLAEILSYHEGKADVDYMHFLGYCKGMCVYFGPDMENKEETV